MNILKDILMYCNIVKHELAPLAAVQLVSLEELEEGILTKSLDYSHSKRQTVSYDETWNVLVEAKVTDFSLWRRKAKV